MLVQRLGRSRPRSSLGTTARVAPQFGSALSGALWLSRRANSAGVLRELLPVAMTRAFPLVLSAEEITGSGATSATNHRAGRGITTG